jgi:hypothetical protein
MRNEPSSGQIDISVWLLRLLTWDGVLPFCMILIPHAARLLFPNNGLVIVFLAVGLPIAALFFRIRAGCQHIDENNCGPTFQKVQVWSMVFGALVLVLIDAMLIVMHEMGARAFLATQGDRIVVGSMVLTYLIAMAVAMYPGRSKPLPTTLQLESPP